MERDENYLRQDSLPVTQTARIGDRVIRELTDEKGKVVAADANRIKVKWASGNTSYFLRGSKGNIRKPEAATAPAEPPTQRQPRKRTEDFGPRPGGKGPS